MKFRYYLLQRLLMIIPTFIIVSFLMYYLLLVFYHGQPVILYINSPRQLAYYKTHPVALAALEAKYGFNQPWWFQWFLTVYRILTGNWGYSPSYGLPILTVVQKSLSASLEFVIPGIILAVLIGIPYGIKSAVAQPKQDLYIYGTSLIGISIPVFIVALFIQGLIWGSVFYIGVITNNHSYFNLAFYSGRYNTHFFTYPRGLILGLPPTGFLLIDSLLSLNLPLFIDAILHLLGPVFCIMLVVLPFIVRMTRMAMTSTLKEDYILLAKSKGLEERIILYKHAFRNALLPLVSYLSYLFSAILIATVFVEVVFGFPGIGLMVFLGFQRFDLGLLLAFLIITSTGFILFNLFIDLLYYFIDPRIKSTGNRKT